jgi:hypothetical protein
MNDYRIHINNIDLSKAAMYAKEKCRSCFGKGFMEISRGELGISTKNIKPEVVTLPMNKLVHFVETRYCTCTKL